MKAIVGLMLLALLGYGCGATPDTAVLEDAEQAEERSVPAAEVTEDAYVEYMAQMTVLAETYADNQYEMARRIQALDEELGIRGEQVHALTPQMSADMEDYMRIVQRIEERIEELRE